MRFSIWLSLIILMISNASGWAQLSAAGELNWDLLQQARIGEEKQVAELLDRGADPNCSFPGQPPERPLIAAISSGKDLVLLNRLLTAGADVNGADSNGWTPLMHAAAQTSLKNEKAAAFTGIMQRLIERGADIHAVSKGGDTALSAAASVSVERFQFMLKAGAKPDFSTLFGAVQGSQTAIVDQLLAAGISAHGVKDGATLVHAIASSRNVAESTPALWDRLLALKLNVNQPDQTGMTPLHEAAQHHHAEATAWLLENGADPNVKNARGETVLHTSLFTGDFGSNRHYVLEPLIRHGAKMEERNAAGLTVLDELLGQDMWQELEEFLTLGGVSAQPGKFLIDLTHRMTTDPVPGTVATAAAERIAPLVPELAQLRHQGKPLILWWSITGTPAMVQILLKAGANPNVSDKQGLTPLMWARKTRNDAIANVLIAGGAKPAPKPSKKKGKPISHPGLTDSSDPPDLPAAGTLMDSIARGNSAEVKHILQSNPGAVKIRQEGYAPLHLARGLWPRGHRPDAGDCRSRSCAPSYG